MAGAPIDRPAWPAGTPSCEDPCARAQVSRAGARPATDRGQTGVRPGSDPQEFESKARGARLADARYSRTGRLRNGEIGRTIMEIVVNPAQAAIGRVDGIDARWEAVMRRDPAADGKFFYAVSTTGVFCRPSCPSRRPRREHVGFHASASDAERAGFRPCRRCRPTEAPLDVRRREAVAAACRAIEASEVAPSLDELAAGAGVSRFHFHRLFKATTGVTPRAYALAQRAARVRRALTANARITDAIYDAGFR